MADEEAVGLHGGEGPHGIEKGFALAETGGFGLEVHDVRAEPRCGGGKADAGARGRLKECEGDGLAAQGGKFFQGMAVEFLEGLGLVQEKKDLLSVEWFDP